MRAPPYRLAFLQVGVKPAYNTPSAVTQMTGSRGTRPRAFCVAHRLYLYVISAYLCDDASMPLQGPHGRATHGGLESLDSILRAATAPHMAYKTIEDTIGNTPLV